MKMLTRKIKRQFAIIFIGFVVLSTFVDIFSVITGSGKTDNEYPPALFQRQGVSATKQYLSAETFKTGNNDLDPAVEINNNIERIFSEEKTQEELELLLKDRAAVHEYYWRSLRRLGNTSDKNIELDGKEREELLGILKRRNLWGEIRTANFEKSGFSPEYEWRILSQLLWQFVAADLYPDLINSTKTKKIVLSDGYKWWNYKGDKLLQCHGSFNRRCELVERWSFLNIKEADAVINVVDAFHLQHLVVPRETANIFFILESPYASPIKNLHRKNDFLASYWRGAEIPASYGTWAYYDPAIRTKDQNRNYAEGKDKMAAIFVSNCQAINNRLDYVIELQKFMEVDVYGACGKFQCERGNTTCFSGLAKSYKFYLAFENSNCRDYITEKFFSNALEHDLLPIVMGGHISDYKARAPENSFIHIEDFASPKDLAEYLTTLSKNDTLYNEYFKWKGTGEFIDTNFMCRVCAMMWYAEVDPPPIRKETMRWRGNRHKEDPMCLGQGAWYWNRPSSEEHVDVDPSM